MKGITIINISAITPNPMNPRRSFDNEALKELAQSIGELGVLQPIIVRTVPEGGFQLVCGERRWRASQLAGATTIPAIVRALTDEEAMDLAITENLQRKDVSPIEEADAFNYLIEKGASITELCARFGKSEFFVRGRLKLVAIIPEIRQMVEAGEVALSQALEVAKFDEDVQRRVCEEHFDESKSYYCWLKLNAKALYDHIICGYTRDLSTYKFDKTECLECPKCSKNFSLFGAADGSEPMECADLECLQGKKDRFGAILALDMLDKYPNMTGLYYSRNNDSSGVADVLRRDGHTICELTNINIWSYAVSDPENHSKLGVLVSTNPQLIYFRGTAPATTDEAKDRALLADLEQKNTRNAEIAEEKIVAEVNEAANSIKFENYPFDEKIVGEPEICMLFAAMVENLTQEQQKVLSEISGVKTEYYSMSSEEAYKIAVKANCDLANCRRLYNVIIRYTLVNFYTKRSRKCEITKHLFEWIDSFGTDITSPIEAKYNSIYEKRKAKIDEKISETEFKILGIGSEEDMQTAIENHLKNCEKYE